MHHFPIQGDAPLFLRFRGPLLQPAGRRSSVWRPVDGGLHAKIVSPGMTLRSAGPAFDFGPQSPPSRQIRGCNFYQPMITWAAATSASRRRLIGVVPGMTVWPVKGRN